MPGKYLKAMGAVGQVFLLRTVLHCKTGIRGLYLLKVSSVPLTIVTKCPQGSLLLNHWTHWSLRFFPTLGSSQDPQVLEGQQEDKLLAFSKLWSHWAGGHRAATASGIFGGFLFPNKFSSARAPAGPFPLPA